MLLVLGPLNCHLFCVFYSQLKEIVLVSLLVFLLPFRPFLPWVLIFLPLINFNFTQGSILVAQIVKNLPAMWETGVWSLSWEDPLEKGMATHSSILACRIPWTEEPGGLQSLESQRVRHIWVTNTHTWVSVVGVLWVFHGWLHLNSWLQLLPICWRWLG